MTNQEIGINKLVLIVSRNAWKILIVIGILNLLRGFMHTMMVEWVAENISKLDLSVLLASIRERSSLQWRDESCGTFLIIEPSGLES